MKRSLLGLALMASLMTANAQPMIVKDINPGTGSSFPFRLTVFGKKLIFAADDGTNGFELWAKDSSGTNLAFNINPAAASGLAYTANRNMAVIGKYAYFPANNGTSGTELYRWDGVNPPTLAAEIAPGAVSSNIDEVIALNGKLYFDANDGTYGEELWMYDTTLNTASRLTDIYTAGSSNLQDIHVYNNKLYFSAFNTTNGQELYSYDPATNATTLVLDIETGAGNSSPNNLVIYNNKLYFTSSTTANGRELYSYNGTNVQRLTDVMTGSNSGINTTGTSTQMIIGMGNFIYFSGNESLTSTGHLYKFDPATNITTLVYKINPTGSSSITNFASYPGRIVFSANNGTLGSELWQYTGTGIPTLVADIRTGAIGSSPSEFCLMGNTMYFQAFDSTNGTELYKFYDTTLSVKNMAFTGNVSVFPNPASSNVTFAVSLTEKAKLGLKLYDMTGRMVYNMPVTEYVSGTNNVNVPVGELANGTYIYSLYDEKGTTMINGRLSKQ